MLNWQQIIEKNSAFINFNVKETNDHLRKGIQSSYQCKGTIFQYRGFNVQIFNSEYKRSNLSQTKY